MKLDRLHQAELIQAVGTENPSLNLEYSPNAQEWYPADQVTDKSWYVMFVWSIKQIRNKL